MKYIIAIIFILFSISAFSQHEINLRIAPGKDPDTSNWLSFYPSGNGALTGRGVTKSYETLANILSPLMGCIDSIFVNAGDSLVIYTCIQDTIYFAGGGGSGLSDGDKGDITVSSGGTVWNIDANTIGTNEVINNDLTEDDLAANSVGASELQVSGVIAGTYPYPVNLKVDSDGRLTQVHDGQEPVTWDDTTSFIATFDDLEALRDSSWLKLNTNAIPENIDTAYRLGPTLMGWDTLIRDGAAVLQLVADSSVSALDISQDMGFAIRFWDPDYTDPTAYIDSRGAFRTRHEIVISADDSGSGTGYSINPPTNDQFMLAINGDIPGPCIQVKRSASAGAYNFGGLDENGNYTWLLEGDGTLRWGPDSIQDMDVDLYRDGIGRLKTTTNFAYGSDYGTPNRLVGRQTSGGYLSTMDWSTVVDSLGGYGGLNYAWLKSGGLVTDDPSDNAADKYSTGDIHIGDATMVGNGALNVAGTMSLNQALAVNNIWINGGNLTATGLDNVGIQVGAGEDMTDGVGNVLVGKYAGRDITGGDRNVGLGAESLYTLTTGNNNMGIGFGTLHSLLSNSDNTAIGANSLYAATGSSNVSIGANSGQNLSAGDNNVFIGVDAGNSTSSDNNTAIGRYAGYSMTGGGIAIGYGAGFNDNTSNKLYIHNAGGSSLANGKLISLLYGEMDATTANQLLHINAKVLPRYMGSTIVTPAGYDATGYLTNSSWPVFIDSLEANGLPAAPTTEAIQDIVGAMFTGNTETNVTVDYQDADGTIDVVVSGGSDTKPALKFTWDGNGGVITTGNTIYTVMEYAVTITGWSIVATGTSPTTTIDVWRVATGTTLPTVANTIMGTKPALSSGNAVRSTTLTGWSPVSFSAGDIIGVNIDALANATWMQFKLEVQ